MTTGQIVRFATGTIGVDKTGASITASEAASLFELGYRFALRSIGVPNVPASQDGALSANELQGLWEAGLAASVFQLNFLQTVIDSAQGTADGAYMARQAQALGFPAGQGFVLWFDLEGRMAGAAAGPLLDYVNAWGAAVAAAGYSAGLYVGNQTVLSGQAISNLANYHAYWQAGQLVPAVAPLEYVTPRRGYQIYQLFPPAQTIAGVIVDIDVVQQDYAHDSAPFWGPAEAST